jgi:hypothetical protein
MIFSLPQRLCKPWHQTERDNPFSSLLNFFYNPSAQNRCWQWLMEAHKKSLTQAFLVCID